MIASGSIKVDVRDGSSKDCKTIQLTMADKTVQLIGPLAIKFQGLYQALGLLNRTFVNGCAIRSGNTDVV